ncbi:hypothetical protein PGTUg99_034745 [Puccinia graminis f. sp. tritici]|uniref:Uncharacterized protein n=1 Tax=Puccinia graminis f. sp. tritici TaxID=56615 RepID=A0A5B0SFA7_PUCGR|nr:hypothetical protein PGTUg99_034745 [Puccinia graminis f. sp. tritici]
MSCVLWCGSLDSRLTNNSPTKTRNTSSGDARLESQTRSSPGRIGPLAPDLGLGHGTGLDIRRGKRYAATIVAQNDRNRSDSEETDSLDHWSFRALYKKH